MNTYYTNLRPSKEIFYGNFLQNKEFPQYLRDSFGYNDSVTFYPCFPNQYENYFIAENESGKRYFCRYGDFDTSRLELVGYLSNPLNPIQTKIYELHYPKTLFSTKKAILSEHIPNSCKHENALVELIDAMPYIIEEYHRHLNKFRMVRFHTNENKYKMLCGYIFKRVQNYQKLTNKHFTISSYLNMSSLMKMLFHLVTLAMNLDTICHGNIIPRYIRSNQANKKYLTNISLNHRPGGIVYDLVRAYDWTLVKGDTTYAIDEAKRRLENLLTCDFDNHELTQIQVSKKSISKSQLAALIFSRLIGVLCVDISIRNTLGNDDKKLAEHKITAINNLLVLCKTMM